MAGSFRYHRGNRNLTGAGYPLALRCCQHAASGIDCSGVIPVENRAVTAFIIQGYTGSQPGGHPGNHVSHVYCLPNIMETGARAATRELPAQ